MIVLFLEAVLESRFCGGLEANFDRIWGSCSNYVWNMFGCNGCERNMLPNTINSRQKCVSESIPKHVCFHTVGANLLEGVFHIFGVSFDVLWDIVWAPCWYHVGLLRGEPVFQTLLERDFELEASHAHAWRGILQAIWAPRMGREYPPPRGTTGRDSSRRI